MKNKYLYSFLLILGSLGLAQAQIKVGKVKVPTKLPSTPITNTSNALTESEIIQGLKEALTQGSNKASSTLNQVDGFNKNPRVRIPFPEDAIKVANTLRNMGQGDRIDKFELTLNRAAEQAAKEAGPIFTGAIKQMSISDAKNILTGSDTSATQYLRKSTYNNLFDVFKPHITKALGDNMVTAQWTEITTIYNKLPTTKTKVNTDLVSFTNHKALKGLFTLVADEETKIRKDPMARTSDILKKVFGSNNK